MLSPADLLIIGAAALLFFGPDQLPKVARQAGRVVRDVQATSQSFVREMERAADESETKHRREAVVPWHPIEVERVTEPAKDVAPDHLMEDGGVENPVGPRAMTTDATTIPITAESPTATATPHVTETPPSRPPTPASNAEGPRAFGDPPRG